MRSLTLLIHNLAAVQFANNKQRYPTTEAFLARSAVTSDNDANLTAWVCASFGIKRQYDWPAGAVLARAHGAPADMPFWICAQPVHLAVDRDDLVLRPRSQLDLSEHESRTLFSLLETHFAGYELAMKHIDTGLWCVGAKRSQHLVTTPIELAEARSVDGLQPSGKDAPWWQRLVTEAQMTFHEHPLNAAREQRGEAPINSVWLWGGGTVPAVHKRFDAICIDEPLLRAAALLSHAQRIEMPNNAFDVIADYENTLVELVISPNGGPGAPLSELESNWFEPAWLALGNGRLDELIVVLPLPNAVIVCRCDRKARRRFWKRRQVLPGFVSRFLAH